jgi:hypothetical protein
MGEAAPVKGPRRRQGPNLLVILGLLFTAVLIIRFIVEVTL